MLQFKTMLEPAYIVLEENNLDLLIKQCYQIQFNESSRLSQADTYSVLAGKIAVRT